MKIQMPAEHAGDTGRETANQVSLFYNKCISNKEIGELIMQKLMSRDFDLQSRDNENIAYLLYLRRGYCPVPVLWILPV